MRWQWPLISILAVAVVPAQGHHSLTGIYESGADTRLQGTVTEFRFVNPHPVLVLEVEAEGGETVSWELEMDNRRELVRIGMTAATLAPGDRVFVRGSRGRAQPQRLYLRRLDRPADGFWYEQRGSTPYLGTGPVTAAPGR